MKKPSSILLRIMEDVRKEMASARELRPIPELKRRIPDLPPVRSLPDALRADFGLIAEIKERSPSHGPMRRQNVDAAPMAYENSGLVRAISVLTNATHFGMGVERLQAVKLSVTKPVLRKDFIVDEYQVYEARAFGADAILLMANLLEADEMRRLYELARELGLEALFECHTREQIQSAPAGAVIYGINSRTFDARKNTLGLGRYGMSSLLGRLGSEKDLTVDLTRFELSEYLPLDAIKVAESGVRPATVAAVRDGLGYHAALVGTSLLTAADGVEKELLRFEEALGRRTARHHAPMPASPGGAPGKP